MLRYIMSLYKIEINTYSDVALWSFRVTFFLVDIFLGHREHESIKNISNKGNAVMTALHPF